MFADSMGLHHGNPSLLFGPNANDSSKVNGALYSIASPMSDPQHSYGARPPHHSNSAPPAPPAPPAQSDFDRIIRPADLKSENALKTVSLPRDCLQRFLAIAKVNTEMNKETCGLLLGKDKGHKFVVTTLLIPKQHATSDTCTMDEEELVLQFTEERSLITLGWVRFNRSWAWLAMLTFPHRYIRILHNHALCHPSTYTLILVSKRCFPSLSR
jgi:STAM-binding protein